MRDTTPTAAALAHSRTFPAIPACAREARRFLTATLGASPACDDAALCLSELVTNATLHSHSARPGGTFTVTIQQHAGYVRVEVHDNGGPWTQQPSSPTGTHGRGLLIVSQLAHAWGRTGTPHTGWCVWYEIGYP
jgi:anti-sigma regulatory factor (Ser/Thr protein kinase)